MERQQTGLSRRDFIKGAVAGGVGVLAVKPDYAWAQTLLSGRTAAEVQGTGIPQGIVRLSYNENPIGPSPMAIEAIMGHAHEVHRYHASTNTRNPEQFLALKLKRIHGVLADLNLRNPDDQKEAIRRQHIFVCHGSERILIAAVTKVLGNGGGEVIEAAPAYGSVARTVGFLQSKGGSVEMVHVPLKAGNVHDLEAMQQAITDRTRLVIITNPNNPTGTLTPRDELERFIAGVPERVLIIIDEAYIHFAEPGYQDAMDLGLKHKNVLVSRTFSKVYGLAGMRIGYALGPPGLFDYDFEFYAAKDWGSINRLAILAATAALDDKDHIRRSQETIWQGKRYLYEEFDKLGLSYTPTQSSFMVVDMKQPSTPIVARLRDKNVFVRDADGPLGYVNLSNHIRVSIGLMEENEAFITALKGALG